jgi:hypothetical protein
MKFKIIIILVVAIVLAVAGFLIWASVGKHFPFNEQEVSEQEALKNVETVVYAAETPFNIQEFKNLDEAAPEDIGNLTKKMEDAFSELKVDKTEIVIPANSEVHLAFKSFCLDHSLSAPDSYVPMVFSYEKIDMPLFFEIGKYMLEQPDIDQPLMQDLIWDLSADKKSKFEDLSDEEQQLLLKIDPSAQEIVDSYQYYRNISVRNFIFGENLPEDVVAQPLPGTELYVRVSDTSSYDYTELDLYNPSAKSQTFPLIKEGEGILTLMPKDSIEEVDADGLIFGVAAGKFDISGNNFRTPADAGVVLLSEEGKEIILKAGTEISLPDLAKKLGQSENTSFFQVPQAQAGSPNWKNWAGSGFQRKLGGKPEPPQLTDIVGVRG